MVKYLLRRIIQMFALFLVFLTLLFFLLEAQPGDLSQQFVGNPNIPPEAKARLIETLGLDKPPAERYLTYMQNYFKGELGVSLVQYPKRVSTMLWEALPRTIVLFLSATLLAFWLGFLSGKHLAWRRGERSEYGITVGGVFLNTVFYPWFALLMIWMFAYAFTDWTGFRLFPINGFIDVTKWFGAPFAAHEVFTRMILVATVSAVAGFVVAKVAQKRLSRSAARTVTKVAFVASLVAPIAYFTFSPMRPYAADIFHHMMLPVITLTLVTFAGTMLLTRSSMLETLREDYILTARAKGLPDSAIRDRHAARNALLPVTTSLVLALAFVIGGGIITESIFSWPGVGLVLFEAVIREDIPVAMGALSIVAVLALIGHLVADILYLYLDPRIRYQ